ncbi:MAG: FAD-dependent oxidoreductase [Owenweeksia sp.]|nr:FAD-dependent oxidoreductase [Owenweeksia sp.]
MKTFHEQAEFIDPHTLQIGDIQIEADKIIIATGAKPRPMGIPGADHALMSTDFLNLDKMPESLLFIGGGYIAFEFAHIAARAGAEVTILHRGKRPLENFDSDIVHLLYRWQREQLGVKIHLGTEAEKSKERQQNDRRRPLQRRGS